MPSTASLFAHQRELFYSITSMVSSTRRCTLRFCHLVFKLFCYFPHVLAQLAVRVVEKAKVELLQLLQLILVHA